MPYASPVTSPGAGIIPDALEVHPCEDCGHQFLDHWTPKPHHCNVEDCYCPAWRDPEVAPNGTRFLPFPAPLV